MLLADRLQNQAKRVSHGDTNPLAATRLVWRSHYMTGLTSGAPNAGSYRHTDAQSIRERFGALIRRTRLDQRMKSKTLAELVGVDRKTIEHIEGAKCNPPTSPVILALADALNLNSDELFAVADRIPDDIRQVILTDPQRLCALIRSAQQ